MSSGCWRLSVSVSLCLSVPLSLSLSLSLSLCVCGCVSLSLSVSVSLRLSLFVVGSWIDVYLRECPSTSLLTERRLMLPGELIKGWPTSPSSRNTYKKKTSFLMRSWI